MQFSNIFPVLALAMTAAALPAAENIDARGGGGGQCSGSHPKQLCVKDCNGGLLGILCNISLGGDCTFKCCTNDAPQVSFTQKRLEGDGMLNELYLGRLDQRQRLLRFVIS